MVGRVAGKKGSDLHLWDSNLYRFAYDDRIDEPDQLRLWREEA